MKQASEYGRKQAFLLAAIYLCALVFVIVSAARIGLSQYFATTANTGQSLANAIFFDPTNPEIYITRGELAFTRQEFSLASENFERASELRNNDFVIWLRLGFSRAELGDIQGAETAYQHSLALAPNFAQPNRLMGLLLLETGADEQGFAHLRKAAAAEHAYYAELLKLALTRYPSDPQAIERVAAPHKPGQKKMLIGYLINNNLMTPGVRQMLIEDALSDQEKDLFINELLSQNKTRLAYELWATKSAVANSLSAKPGEIYDGGFEYISASDSSGFGWRLEQKLAGASVSVDTSHYRTGSRALSIQFTGNLDPGTKIISQRSLVKPHTNYRLSFAAMSNGLTSGGLPVITITQGQTHRAASAMIEATGGKWIVMNVEFRSGAEESVLIALERANCTTNPCPIFGDLSLDDFSIIETDSK